MPLLDGVRHVPFGDADAVEQVLAAAKVVGDDIAAVVAEPVKISLKQRGIQMKQRIAEGSAEDKRYKLAVNILKDAVRIPRTTGYLG